MRFDSPSGAIAARVQVESRPSGCTDGRLRLILGAEAAAAVHAEDLFHFTSEVRPGADWPTAPGPMHLILRPGPEILTAGGLPDSDDPGDLAEWFRADRVRSGVDSWFVTRLERGDPPTVGRTLWDHLPEFRDIAESDGDPTTALDAVTEFFAEQHPELGWDAGDLHRLIGALAPTLLPAIYDASRADGGTPAGNPETAGGYSGTDPLDALETFLIGSGAEPIRLTDGAGLKVAVSGRRGDFPCLVLATSGTALIFYGLIPEELPAAGLRDAMAEIVRWNSNQLLGTLDVEVDSGRVAYRVPVLLTGPPVGPALFDHALAAVIDGMDGAAELLGDLIAKAH